MDASDIRDEDFNPSNFEDPAQQGGYPEEHHQQAIDEQSHHHHHQQQQQDVHGVSDEQIRQNVLHGLANASVAYHYAVPGHNPDGQVDLEIGDMTVDQVDAGDELGLVGVTGEEVDEQQPQHLGYDMSAQHASLAQEQHGYVEPQVPTEYSEEHPTTVLDDHHLSTNQFPNPDMRLPSIPHSSSGYHVNYAEQSHPEHMDINLDIVGELSVDTTLANNHSSTEQQGAAEQVGNSVDHLAMDPSIDVSPESARREPASGKAARVRQYARRSAEIPSHAAEEGEYREEMADLSVAGSSSRRRTTKSGHKSGLDNGETLAGPSSVSVDPEQPLSADEIRRRQNRSRASGKVLPRGGACDFCKRRKLRCDGVRPECGHCAKNVGRQYRSPSRHRAK